ncbi:TIGR03084 family metal-binding protein [Streptomyces purpurogeneiscleroticus]|uniref:TIGR03084 family metal-binding protein n=1 Tax=Streptomyces purpurogeneiscleroticus TaxID=68259 RepID=UPI001CC1B7DC|nr:TIGR03084 family metal-binding protein [Streptomyces purpurogeneiscleroticus]MBZ4017142.1 TIGR03084 family protein [Streptomyces purpurogeneiscleroticus]
MSDPSPVLADLRAEGQALDALVEPLTADRWAVPTPAAGWTIAHQIAHLAWTDQQALRAATDPDGFRRAVEAALASPDTFVDEGAEEGARRPPAELLAHWRAGRDALHDALAAYTGGRLPWFGPPMSITSMATARLMETWAHGQDVADALGVVREPTARLRHVAHIGVRARNFAYLAHGLTPPEEEFRVELRAPGPDGGVWAYGPEDAAQRVTGDALGFCLLVTQRAHRDDVDVRAEGAEAERWLGIAQAFAGPPGPGRGPRSAAAPKEPTA